MPTVVANTGKTKQNSKIEREIKMNSRPENNTFSFLLTHRQNAKKLKELFFANARTNTETEL